MSKLITYLKYEGLTATVQKCLETVKNRNKASETVFLKCCNLDTSCNPNVELEIFPLTEERLEDFKSIQFFDFLCGENYINNPTRYVVLGYVDGQIVGYETIECLANREIHGLGTFQLNPDEAWIGPSYVKKEFRGRGIVKKLIRSAVLHGFQVLHVKTFYTCINGRNIASIKSAERMGFEKIGTVITQNGQCSCQLDAEFANKFSAPDDPAKLDRH